MSYEKKQLEQAGYRVKVFSRYHWEISKPGTKKVVAVWPTAHKILIKYDPGPAPRYTGTMLAAVDKQFEKLVLPPTYTQQELEDMEFFFDYRSRPLEFIRELYLNV